MQILFYDTIAPLNYTHLTLRERPLRGTEATVTRIAHALRDCATIYIAQQQRLNKENQTSEGVHYISLATAHQLTPDVVILLRDYHELDSIGKRYPNARHYFWMHNMPPRDLANKWQELQSYQFEIIAVSQFHRQAIQKRLRGRWYQRLLFRPKNNIPVHVIYNPIDNELNPDHSKWQPNQLIFTSAAYKGLAMTLDLFTQVRRVFPEYELSILSPEPVAHTLKLPPQVKVFPGLPYYELIKKVRESFCVFYPQTERMETFGLVYAEANAVGTPVLAHHFGAAEEVLSDSCQLVNAHHPQCVIEKITEWRKNRPQLTGREEFRLRNVSLIWRKLLGL